MFSLIPISFERYQAVTNPYDQTSKFSRSKVKSIIICCWIFTTIFNLPLFFVLSYDKEDDLCLESWPSAIYGKVNSSIWLLVVGIIPTNTMIYLYSKVVFDLWFKQINGATQIVVRKSRKKVTKVVLIVSVIYAISWFPQLTLYLLSNFLESFEFGGVPYIAFVVMVAFNLAVNPMIYAFQSERFRREFKQLLCFRSRRNRVLPGPVRNTDQRKMFSTFSRDISLICCPFPMGFFYQPYQPVSFRTKLNVKTA